MILNFIKFADMTKRENDIFSQDVKGVLSPRGLQSALRATSFWMHATWMPRPSNACSLQLPHGAMEGRLQQSSLGSQNSAYIRRKGLTGMHRLKLFSSPPDSLVTIELRRLCTLAAVVIILLRSSMAAAMEDDVAGLLLPPERIYASLHLQF